MARTPRQLRPAHVASGLAPDDQFIVRPKAAGTRHAQLDSLSCWVSAPLLLRFAVPHPVRHARFCRPMPPYDHVSLEKWQVECEHIAEELHPETFRTGRGTAVPLAYLFPTSLVHRQLSPHPKRARHSQRIHFYDVTHVLYPSAAQVSQRSVWSCA